MQFRNGDRVVIKLTDYPETGTVKWIGKAINSHPYQYEINNCQMIGIEFDKPVGHQFNPKGTEGRFEAKPNHGAILPAPLVSNIEDHYFQAQHRRESHTDGGTLLGSDMANMSAFHKMAYAQISGANNSDGNSMDSWNIIPSLSHSSTNKEILDEPKQSNRPPKPKHKNYSKNMSSTYLEEKPINMEPKERPTTLTSTVRSNLDIGYGGAISDDSDQDYEYPDFTKHPYFHLSRLGIDQIEVITDEISSPVESSKEDCDISIGSLVEIPLKNGRGSLKNWYGVIRWIGSEGGRKLAGIELEDGLDGICNGTLKGHAYFDCPKRKGIFVLFRMCFKDSRFIDSLSSGTAFGSADCQPIFGSIPPLTGNEVSAMFGRNKGIQGHQNSCYLDATLFSMFAFTSVFDSLLFRPPDKDDISEYCDVQSVLREEIVNPLRQNMFVRADRIMKLRTMLDNLSSVRGLTTAEKDPEAILQSLLAQSLRAEPYLQLSSGQEAYHYQLFVDKDEKLSLPSVQMLFDQSFMTSDIKLKQIPSCLIIQMPRFGKDYKMYDRILPSMVLDVTDVIENSPRQCIVCGKLAEMECRECYGHWEPGLDSIAFCVKCLEKNHSHRKRGSHSARQLNVPNEFRMLKDHCGSIPRVYMELFAVVCIETSHYVTFTRCGSGADATWCFFDSMADRKGEQHGYNIPTVVECGDLMQWVDEQNTSMLQNVADKALPDLPRRLLCDAYLCFYQSPQVMMYR